MRWVSTRVLPDPAPATTSSGPSVVDDRLALDRVQALEQCRNRRRGHHRAPYRWPPTASASRSTPEEASEGRSLEEWPDRCPVRAPPAPEPTRESSRGPSREGLKRTILGRLVPARLQPPRAAPARRRPAGARHLLSDVNPALLIVALAPRDRRLRRLHAADPGTLPPDRPSPVPPSSASSCRPRRSPTWCPAAARPAARSASA